MAKEKKAANKSKALIVEILVAYNDLFASIFEQSIFTDKENKNLKLIFQKFSEISALIEDLKT